MPDTERIEFDWHDTDEVIVREQPAVAVYLNLAGDIVLRQQGDVFDDDAWIWFHPEHAAAIAAAILEAAGLDAPVLTPSQTTDAVLPKDPTAAERQRKYRERKKKKPTPEPDIFERDVTDPATARNRVT